MENGMRQRYRWGLTLHMLYFLQGKKNSSVKVIKFVKNLRMAYVSVLYLVSSPLYQKYLNLKREREKNVLLYLVLANKNFSV